MAATRARAARGHSQAAAREEAATTSKIIKIFQHTEVWRRNPENRRRSARGGDEVRPGAPEQPLDGGQEAGSASSAALLRATNKEREGEEEK